MRKEEEKGRYESLHFVGLKKNTFVALTENKDGGRGVTAGERNRRAAERSVEVCEQIKPLDMTLARELLRKNAAVKTSSELRAAEVIILFFNATDQRCDLIVLTFSSHCLTQSPSLHMVSFEHPIS